MRDPDPFGDAVYETWRRGGNPDHVDRDRIEDDRAAGYYEHEELVEREVRRCTTPRPKAEEE